LQTHLSDQPALDWLRFVLASIVLLDHAGWDIPGPITGQLAVWVFLALSGWLIGGILLRTPVEELPRFYFNRAIRIWIPYGCAIFMLYAVAAAKEGIDFNWWKYLFYDVSFTHYNFTVFPQADAEMPLDGTGNNFWSISVEEQFYLIAPLLLCFVGLGGLRGGGVHSDCRGRAGCLGSKPVRGFPPDGNRLGLVPGHIGRDLCGASLGRHGLGAIGLRRGAGAGAVRAGQS
jgi:peptidoglycan/LPS O-acetylase OafA/YrhL